MKKLLFLALIVGVAYADGCWCACRLQYRKNLVSMVGAASRT